MPIYLVRWPDLSAALVKAGSEDELIETLDEIANPDACTWSVYRGPLFLEFSLPAKFDLRERGERNGPISPDDLVIEDVSRLRELTPLEAEVPDADTGLDMCEAIEKKAFPHLFKVRHGRDEDPSDDELREAVKHELQALVRASWKLRHVRRRTDFEGRLAAEMDAPPRLVRRWIENAKKNAPTKPKKPRGGRKRKR